MTRHHRPHLAALALCAAMAATVALPTTTLAADAQALTTALATFGRANGGDSAAIEPAAEQLVRLADAEPANPVLRAYAGAATSMKASTTILPWKKMGYADDGLAMLDKALALLTPTHDAPLYRGVPASLEVRFTAARTFLALPSMFNRQPRGAKLLDDVLHSPLLEGSPMGFKAAVWMRAGLEAARAGHKEQARQWLQRVADSGTPEAAAAQARLKEL